MGRLPVNAEDIRAWMFIQSSASHAVLEAQARLVALAAQRSAETWRLRNGASDRAVWDLHPNWVEVQSGWYAEHEGKKALGAAV